MKIEWRAKKDGRGERKGEIRRRKVVQIQEIHAQLSLGKVQHTLILLYKLQNLATVMNYWIISGCPKYPNVNY